MKTRLFWIAGTIAATGAIHLGVILGLASIAGGN
tara:strand:- start:2868 stop:2969 length:102 start_codon:yes stop_codon:yes gene_type:complete